MMRVPSVGVTVFGALLVSTCFAWPACAQPSTAELGSTYLWIGMAIGLALVVGLGIEALWARARNRRLTGLLSQLPSAVFELDRAGTVHFLNSRAQSLLGSGAKPPFPWPGDVHLRESEPSKANPTGASVLDRILGGGRISGEHHVLSTGGQSSSHHHVRVTSNAVLRRNQVETVFLVLDDAHGHRPGPPVSKDIRPRKVIATLAQEIANDFNNALATIAYAIDQSLKQTLPEKAASLLMTALSTIERGQYTSERMQTLAHQSGGQVTRRSVLTMLEDFKLHVLPMLDDGVELKLDCTEPDLVIRCNPAELEVTLQTLTRNAQDAIFGQFGTGCISISAKTAEVDTRVLQLRKLHGSVAEFVELSVSGTRPGLDHAMPRDISDPLENATNGAGGIGSGLAAARAFVSEMRGEIYVDASGGRGAKVCLLLPLEPPFKRGAARSDSPLLRGNGETVFLVEDDPMLLLMLQEELEELGYRVISATSGEAAIGLIEQGVEFDLVIADVVMPGDFNGFDLAAKIKKVRHRAAVLYVSGHSDLSCDDMGKVTAPILRKPCPPNELAHAVQAALKERMM